MIMIIAYRMLITYLQHVIFIAYKRYLLHMTINC